jgi:hypothetical protein
MKRIAMLAAALVALLPSLAAPGPCKAQGIFKGTPLDNTPLDPDTYRIPSPPPAQDSYITDPQTPPPNARQHWAYQGGRFDAVGGGRWVERNSGGTSNFRETQRNGEWVELYDASRGYTLHLHRDAFWIIGGNDRVRRFPQWTRLQYGNWR